jgi:hypothetical protein
MAGNTVWHDTRTTTNLAWAAAARLSPPRHRLLVLVLSVSIHPAKWAGELDSLRKVDCRAVCHEVDRRRTKPDMAGTSTS